MVCTARYKHGRDHYFYVNNGRTHVYIGPYKASRFKNNTFIL